MSDFSVPKEEEKVLKFWKEKDIFARSVSAREKAKPFVFYEGPPTANGQPGIHHVLGRAYKDIILRYKTMQGFLVRRRAGWDTHGLPVEIEVEKELGLKNKKEIEEYGIAAFNKKCKDSVWKYKEDWEKLTDRMGFWIDMKNAYITYEPDYIENLWAIMKKFWDKNLLFEDFKVVPYCVRCGTAISSHEVAQGYEKITDQSVYVKFQVSDPTTHNLQPNTYIVAWTTTPWTLPGNVALAVGEKIDYVVVSHEGENYIVAKELLGNVIKGAKEVKEIKGSDLVGLSYEPLFEVPELKSEKSFKVYPADFVTTQEGTGVVHTSLMYGVDDFELGTKFGLPKFHTVDEQGKFVSSVPVVGGKNILKDNQKDPETEKLIIDYIKQKNLLLKEKDHEHDYPFCWRCKSPLLYYARHSWFLGVRKIKEKLITNNKKINWVPDYIKEGRFGEWLREVKDWAFSRERYWGTPLPLWRCEDKECGHLTVAGSLNDLNKYRLDSPTKFTLIRHGQSLSNKRNVVSSHPETFNNTLTQKGVEQTEKAAKSLGGSKIDIIYTSDLTRTLQTAEIIAKALGVEIKTDERLREVDVGQFNGQDHNNYKNFFKYLKEVVFKRPEEGENWIDVKKRMWSFGYDIQKKHSGKSILIVSHGLPLVLLEASLKGIETDELLQWEEENELGNAELQEVNFPNWSFNKDGELDLHRPYIDEIILACEKCKGKAKRIKELADVWFDSGAMPFARPAYEQKNKAAKKDLGEPVKGQFPADYISEGIDQTRGWFYTLHSISGLLGHGVSYKNVITYAHVLDKNGKKMSKSVGNVVDPNDVIEKYGIDALRWYFFTVNSPGDNKLFREEEVKERYRRYVMTAINSLVFLETYWVKPDDFKEDPQENILDEWIKSLLARTAEEATKSLESYDVVSSARTLDDLVDNISNWYIRRSRSRLQTPELTAEKLSAQQTLWEILLGLSKLVAPFTPFLSEMLYLRLKKLSEGGLLESVHLTDWPKSVKYNSDLVGNMSIVKNLASSALADRADAKIKVRQKLSELALSKEDKEKIRGLEHILEAETNVGIITQDNSLGVGQIKLNTEITPELEREGIFRELVRAVNNLRKEADLTPADEIELYFNIKKPNSETDELSDLTDTLKTETRAKETKLKQEPHDALLAEKEFEERDWKIWVGIKVVK